MQLNCLPNFKPSSFNKTDFSKVEQMFLVSAVNSKTTYLRRVSLSFCREHRTSSIASARELHSIPLIATISSPTANASDESAFPPAVTWITMKGSKKKDCIWQFNKSTGKGKCQTFLVNYRNQAVLTQMVSWVSMISQEKTNWPIGCGQNNVVF